MPESMPESLSVAERIAAFCHEFPAAIALSQGSQKLSYLQLTSRANQFAGYLLHMGTGPGNTVAICMERSFDWIVAALAAMQIGAAYLPLDSAWPDNRVRFALKDSGANILVAPTCLLNRLDLGTVCIGNDYGGTCVPRIVGIDPCRDTNTIAAAIPFKPIAIDPETVAYLIYTSGSTGAPKGVEITHANLAHLIRWHQGAFDITRDDRASHLAGLGFDAAVWELWPHLCAGATVCLAEDSITCSPALIQQWMIGERITIGFVPTVHTEAMLAMNWPPNTPLRFLLTGGDALRTAPQKALPFQLVNNYGPTESAVVATSAVIAPGSSEPPPIGRPIRGATVYLLDEDRAQVADGQVGEIYIGGSGVGRGYRNMPDLTRGHFLPDPFAPTPGARMYRSGDRGVRREDGQIEFRGRLDRQIKIRGRRVELDEIGSLLGRHPSLAFAIAMTHPLDSEENQLVGYILPREATRVPTVDELQKHLSQRLPVYMVPSVFVHLRSLPVSTNGKLDMQLLPRPNTTNVMRRNVGVIPQSAVGQKLLTIMRGLLEDESVGVEDNFFLAGGHSLLGMQLVMRLREAFGVNFTLRQLFESPSVERLAVAVERMQDEQRITAIWQDVLNRGKIAPDDNFFQLGGDSTLMAEIRRRIPAEHKREISVAKLMLNPTVRQQAALLQEKIVAGEALPPGVIALRNSSAGTKIFWAHYLNANLAKLIGDDQSFLSVGLTPEDIGLLGASATLESIAGRLLDKIVATQPKGPYTIGGLCIGGTLAYEIASQLRSSGRDVELLVLLDSSNPTFPESRASLGQHMNYVRYAVKRAKRIGLRMSSVYIRERLSKLFPRTIRQHPIHAEIHTAQQIIEAAALEYQPKGYGGKVLLLLASERPPHSDLSLGWRSLIPRGNLHMEYVEAHHRDLIKSPKVRDVAQAIISHLSPNLGEAV